MAKPTTDHPDRTLPLGKLPPASAAGRTINHSGPPGVNFMALGEFWSWVFRCKPETTSHMPAPQAPNLKNPKSALNCEIPDPGDRAPASDVNVLVPTSVGRGISVYTSPEQSYWVDGRGPVFKVRDPGFRV